jgi:general secretion pathway protein J
MRTGELRRAGGFTLIEILVAIAIFTLVITAIYSGWMTILRASKVGLEAAAQAQRERVAIRTIEEALTSSRSFAADVQHYWFVGENGDDATLSFVARLPDSFPRSGKFGDQDVRRVSFSVENGPDSQRQLVLRQSPILMDFDEDEKEHPLVLARHVKGLVLEFWNPSRNEWLEEWTQTNQLPKMVKVTLQMAPPDQPSRGSSRPPEEITRIVALPSVMVPAGWQMPQLPLGGTPGPPGAPTQPGVVLPGGKR